MTSNSCVSSISVAHVTCWLVLEAASPLNGFLIRPPLQTSSWLQLNGAEKTCLDLADMFVNRSVDSGASANVCPSPSGKLNSLFTIRTTRDLLISAHKDSCRLARRHREVSWEFLTDYPQAHFHWCAEYHVRYPHLCIHHTSQWQWSIIRMTACRPLGWLLIILPPSCTLTSLSSHPSAQVIHAHTYTHTFTLPVFVSCFFLSV